MVPDTTNHTPDQDRSCTRWSLVRRLKDPDDRQAWQDFYTAYGPVLKNLALKSGLSRQEAEDAVQDTMTSVFQALPEFKADPSAGSFKNWLFRLAKWRIINQFNKRPRNASLAADLLASPGGGSTAGTAPIDRIADSRESALQAVWDAEWQGRAVELATRQLQDTVKARHFQVFYLHVLKMQSAASVARALGTSVAQVYLVKCRLLPVFRRILKSIERQPL